MTQPDNEWKVIRIGDGYKEYRHPIQACNIVFDSLLDQIRREAKKELLDEIESQSSIFAGVGTPKLIIEKIKFDKLRAKTLGEKQ